MYHASSRAWSKSSRSPATTAAFKGRATAALWAVRRSRHACVAGANEGLIDEEPILQRPTFVNAYEASKWDAERRVLAQNRSWDIVRAGTVIGSEVDGSVPRLGAIHRVLEWVYRGLSFSLGVMSAPSACARLATGFPACQPARRHSRSG